MKRRLLQGLGFVMVLASPLWIAVPEKANYSNFALSLIIGILILVLTWHAD